MKNPEFKGDLNRLGKKITEVIRHYVPRKPLEKRPTFKGFEEIVPLNQHMIDQALILNKKKRTLEFLNKKIHESSKSEGFKELKNILLDIKETIEEEMRLMEKRRPMEKHIRDAQHKDILTKIKPTSNDVRRNFKTLNDGLWENSGDIQKYVDELHQKYPRIYRAMVDHANIITPETDIEVN